MSSKLSWSHYLELIKIDEDNKRIFSSEYKLHMPTEQELIKAALEEKRILELNEVKIQK